MARLPFETASVLPQQNRLSAPNVPNAPGPMDVSVPGAGAQNRALMSLGESIARIGRTAADIYLTQAEKEKDQADKIAIVEYGQFRDRARNRFLQDLEESPPKDMAEAMARYEYFYTGGDETDSNASGFYQQTQRFLEGKSKQVRKAVEQLFDDQRITDQDLIAMQEIRKQQQATVGASVVNGKKLLAAKMQDLTPEILSKYKNYTPTERRTLIATELEEAVTPALADLPPGLRIQAEERLQNSVLATSGQYFSAIQGQLDDELRAFYVDQEDEILRSPGTREERLGALETMQNSMVSEGLLSNEQAADNLVKYGQTIDNSDILLQRESGDIAQVANLIDVLLKDKDAYPSLTVHERERQITLARSKLQALQDQATRQVRSNLLRTVGAILDPTLTPKQRAEVESPTLLQAQLANVPDGQTRQVFQDLQAYAVATARTITNLPEKSKAELAQAEADLTPPRFIGGALNEDYALFDAVNKQAVQQINTIRKLRESDGARFYQRPEGTNAFDYDNLQSKISTQLNYEGYRNVENLQPRELRGLWQANVVRLFSDQEVQQEAINFRQLTTGRQKSDYVMALERQAGTLAPLVMAELARESGDNGIRLPYSAQLYKEVSNDAVLDNLHAAEQNSEINRKQIGDRFGGAELKMRDVRQEMLANDSFENFFESFRSDPGSTPVVNDFNEAFVDYILEMGNRPNVTLTDAVDMAARHLIEDNYSFIQTNGNTTPPLLIRTELLGGLPAGSAQTALINYTEKIFEDRQQGLIDLAGSDDNWTWAAKGDGSGIELLLFNEELAQFGTTGVVMTFDKLRIITEDHMNNNAIDPNYGEFKEDQAVIDTMLDGYGVGVGKPIERPEEKVVEDVAPEVAPPAQEEAQEPEPEPEDPDLAQLNGFVTQARAFLDTVPGEQMAEVERLIEGAEVLRARIVYNKGKEAAMKQLRLLETQLQLMQGKTASKEQMRKLLGSAPELDPELRAKMEALVRSRKQ